MKKVLINYIELLMSLKEMGIEVEFKVQRNYITGKIDFFEIWRFEYDLSNEEFQHFRHTLTKRYRENKQLIETEKKLAV